MSQMFLKPGLDTNLCPTVRHRVKNGVGQVERVRQLSDGQVKKNAVGQVRLVVCCPTENRISTFVNKSSSHGFMMCMDMYNE